MNLFSTLSLSQLFVIIFTVNLFSAYESMAQGPANVEGQVFDSGSGEPLLGATVFWTSQPTRGTITDENGFFSLEIDSLPNVLNIRFLGYEPISRPVNEKAEFKSNKFFLSPEEMNLSEVVVSERKQDYNVKSTAIGKNEISGAELKRIPALFGEVDLLRSIQLLPGVNTAGEGTTGLFVRGGSSDQNLIQIDGAPIYNPSHFFGFFSVFNPDAISDVALYKGNIPANFGGRASSLVDISLREGNTQKLKGEGGIGSISSRITLDGPLFSEDASFLVSARRTYADVFLGFSSNESIRENQLYFYDLSGKLMWRNGEKDKFTFSTYYGSDFLGLSEQFGLGWNNWINSFKWDRQINERMFLDVTAYYSFYKYKITVTDEDNGFDWSNYFSESGGKATFNYVPNENIDLKFGLHSQLYYFARVDLEFADSENLEPFESSTRVGFQNSFFIAGNAELTNNLSVEAGLRWSAYQQIGDGVNYLYENDDPTIDGVVSDTLNYSFGERMKFYEGLEPRLALRYLISDDLALKGSFNRNFQYIQVASNSSAGLPIDRWIPAGKYIDPIRSDQVSVGVFKNLYDNKWELSLEGYYRDFRNIIDLKQDANVLFKDNVETEILAGDGWAYGLEFLLRKNIGKTTGWLSYTWSRVYRQIEGINQGLPYNPRFDRPHDLSLVLTHELSDRLSLSGTFLYTTGVAVTFPVGSYVVDNQRIPLYDAYRNNSRFPDYHRMDLSLTLKNKDKGRWWKGSWNFSIYNLYGRKNPFSYEFRDIENNDINFDSGEGIAVTSQRPGVVMTYLFGILPSVTYNFNF
ncbi:TonB-dependent receptor [Cyclobacterium marinum]|uniref:TonB-dependent receptor n=1 Tax=Cyclobacterium marinum TaxID=104 RepID=UPI0011ED3EB4|nr:TonB-dependent receptor [Cyclobacterium marinum]MBI0399773.1 TonB-dependent receptor [Cyclobacterium marinum]